VRDRDSIAAWNYYLSQRSTRDSFEASRLEKKLSILKDYLIPSFINLPNISKISVSLDKCPFEEPLLRRIWHISSSRRIPREFTVERFIKILRAAFAANTNLKEMSHDRLPFEFFNCSPRHMQEVRPAFTRLVDLRLVCDYSVFPNELAIEQSFMGLAACLKQASGLEILHLGFSTSQKPVLEFEKYFGEVMLEQLHTLSLFGTKIRVVDVGDFLARHKASLRNLQIGGPVIGMEHGTVICSGTLVQLLRRVRDEMEIDRLSLRGQVIESSEQDSMPTTEKAWSFGSGVYDTDGQWIRRSEDECDAGMCAWYAKHIDRFMKSTDETWPEEYHTDDDGEDDESVEVTDT
jgi:hypothetical protein